MPSSMFYNYVLVNELGHTYNGYTVDLHKRLRQHNGYLKGGARSTKGRGPWRYLMVVTSTHWNCISDAMKFEWYLRYPTRKKPRPKVFHGKEGRINSIVHILKCHNNTDESHYHGICSDLTIYITPEWYTAFKNKICTEEYKDACVQVLEDSVVGLMNNPPIVSDNEKC